MDDHRIATAAMFLLLMILPCRPFCQLPYNIVHYTSNNGLPQNSITSMAFDRYGTLWLTTQAGICSFDGQNFQHYNRINNNLLKSDRFIALAKMEDGNLSALDDNWNRYVLPDYGNPDAANNILERFSSKNNLSISDHGGLSWFDNLKKNKDWNAIYKRNDSLIVPVQVIINDHQGYLQVGANLYFLDNKKNIVRDSYMRPWKTGYNEPIFTVDSLMVYCKKNGYEIYSDGRLLKDVHISPDVAAIIKRFANLDGVRLPQSLVMIKNGIYQLRIEDNTIKAVLLVSGLGLRPVDIKCSLYDTSRNLICLGTFTSGLYLIKKKCITSIDCGSISEVLSLGNDECLSSSYRFNVKKLTCQRLKKRVEPYTLFKTKDGTVWPWVDGMLCRSTNQFTSFSPVCKMNDYGARLEKENFLWMTFDNALWKVDIHQGAKKILDINMHVGIIFQYGLNTLWMFSNESVFEYDIRNNRLSNKPILTGLPIRTIYRATDGSIWITTYGMGMYKWINGKALQLPLDKLQCLKYSHSIFEDKNGFFWIPTNNGLIQCLKTELDSYFSDSSRIPLYYRYDESDGLATNEFNGGSQMPYDTTQDGTIIYPTLKGPIFFHPLHTQPSVSPSTLHLQFVEVDNRSVKFGPRLSNEVTGSFNYIKIKLSYPYFGNYNNLKVEYNIRGLNNEWEEVGANRMITINRLPHGIYELVIRLKTDFRSNAYIYQKLSFRVLPKVYERLWFQLMCFALFVLFIVMIYRFRHNSLIDRKLALDNEVAAKTMELNESILKQDALINKLHRSEKELLVANGIKEKTIGIILHDIKTPLQYLDTTAMAFYKNIASFNQEDIMNFSAVFAETTFKTNGFLTELLQWLLSQQEGFAINRTTFSTEDFYREIKGIFNEIARIKHNQILIKIETDKEISTDRHMLHLIVRNLVDNAIKHTKNGVITLLSQSDELYFRLIIKDTGRGMNIDQLSNIQGEHSGKLFHGSNLGISLVKAFLALVGGEIWADSYPGQGTTIKLTFPINSTLTF